MRWINSKLSDILHASSCCEYSLIAITETGIHSGVQNAEFMDVEKYIVMRCDRDYASSGLNRGGGVCLGISSILNPVNLDLKNLSDFKNFTLIDIVGARITVGIFSFYVFVLYIPPGMPHDTYTSLFEVLSSLYYLNDAHILILGDFNIPEYVKLLDCQEKNLTVLALNNFCQFFNLEQFNFIRNTNNRLLDLVLANFNCTVIEAPENIVTIDNHHPPLHIIFNAALKPLKNKVKSNKTFYNFKKADLVSLYQTIAAYDWTFLHHCDNASSAFQVFYEILYVFLDRYVPLMKASCRQYPPWYNSGLIKNIRKKHKLFEYYKSNRNPFVLEEFKQLRRQIKIDCERLYKAYCQAAEGDIKTNPSRFWNFVRRKKGINNLPTSMEYKSNQLTDGTCISEAFAEFFKDSYAPTDQNNDSPSHPPEDFTNNAIPLTLSCNQFTVDEVETALKKMKPKNTMGPDKIPAFLIHDCATVLAPPLTILYNLSLKTCVFPEVLKKSRIVPIHKKGNVCNVENYRPITIINNFSKVFESILYQPMFFHVKHMLTDRQHGFLKNRSTVTNLFCITQYIATAIDEHAQVDVVYTDFSKAFDKLDHKILVHKFNTFGFDTKLCNFLENYLTKRCQYVDFRGFASNEFVAPSGVPQGSILGPLFFNMYINDIGDNLSIPYLLYADDLKLYSIINNISDCVLLQNELEKIYQWCLKNKLHVNVSKCNVLSFSLKQEENMLEYEYSLNKSLLPRSDTFRDLGVIFDRKLSFTSHIQHLSSISYKTLGFVIRNTDVFRDTSTSILLYNAYVRSKMEYGSLIWAPYYAVHSDALERIQRRFLKCLAYREDGSYPDIGYPQFNLLERFSVKSLRSRRNTSENIFLHKLIHNNFDCSEILGMLQFHVPRVHSRHRDDFYVKTANTNVLKNSPLLRMCSQVNSLPSSLDIFSSSINSVKNVLS